MQIEHDLIKKDLREEMNRVADAMATGACKDFGEYTHMTGIIEGLAYAERMLLDRVEAQKKAEGEEE